MSSLLDLPEEIIIKIIRDLDLNEIQNLYNTCTFIRNIIYMYGVVRECNMSMNTLATAHTLKLDFFKDISGHLQVLNMRGVHDLTKSSLLPAMKKMKKLISLDISYTKLSIIDLLEIQQVCPTIRNVSINFIVSKPETTVIHPKTLLLCQNLFQNFDNINFVGSFCGLMLSKLSFNMLSKANLNNLNYTIIEYADVITIDHNVIYNELIMPQFSQFNVYLMNWKNRISYNCRLNNILPFSVISKYEVIIIIVFNCQIYKVYGSELFKRFFHDKFAIQTEYITEEISIQGNEVIMIWNKNSTIFDNTFFLNLEKSLRQYIPCNILSNTSTLSSVNSDWFIIFPTPVQLTEEADYNICAPSLKKRRIVAPNLILNYDDIFEGKNKIKLSLMFVNHIKNAVSLTSSCNYLKKITYLSICGTLRFSSEFFNILFRCCDNLMTLNVESPSISPCAPPISRSIPLSRCLKNIRLIDKRIDFITLFSSLSQCKTLENIYVLEGSMSDPVDLGDPGIVLEKCNNLYNLYIQAPMSDTVRTKKFTLLNKAKSRCGKFNVNIEIHAKSIDSTVRYNYSPFVDVFDLYPIKPM